jgi:hypothetical protein
VKSAKLNGKSLHGTSIPHKEIAGGGVLEFEMTDAPVKSALRLISRSDSLFPDQFLAVPLIEGGGRVFNDRTMVMLSTTTPGAQIVYTLDGREPDENSKVYENPLTIGSTSTIKAKALIKPPANTNPFLGGWRAGMTAEARFFKKPNDWTVQIAHKYNRQYTGGGDEGLIDGIRGTLNWASGEWQGYQPKDLLAVIDLQRETEIKRVGGGFLQDARPWIWMPTRIEFEVSSDGMNFTKVADIKTDVDPKDMTPTIRDYKQDITPVRARYVRVRAYNLGKIPAWHPGAGDDAFIFVDEIFVE